MLKCIVREQEECWQIYSFVGNNLMDQRLQYILFFFFLWPGIFKTENQYQHYSNITYSLGNNFYF